MSGSFAMPLQVTGGAGYKANHTYDDFLRKHSGFYRRKSSASNALEEDRRASQVDPSNAAAAAAAAVAAVSGEGARRGSVAAAMAQRKGSVTIDSPATRRDSIFGMEPTAGADLTGDRRPSTSLAHDLVQKMKGNKPPKRPSVSG